MDESELISSVLARMAQLGVTQTELASACDLSQAHLSKVLSLQVKLAQKTERKLSAWRVLFKLTTIVGDIRRAKDQKRAIATEPPKPTAAGDGWVR